MRPGERDPGSRTFLRDREDRSLDPPVKKLKNKIILCDRGLFSGKSQMFSQGERPGKPDIPLGLGRLIF